MNHFLIFLFILQLITFLFFKTCEFKRLIIYSKFRSSCNLRKERIPQKSFILKWTDNFLRIPTCERRVVFQNSNSQKWQKTECQKTYPWSSVNIWLLLPNCRQILSPEIEIFLFPPLLLTKCIQYLR